MFYKCLFILSNKKDNISRNVVLTLFWFCRLIVAMVHTSSVEYLPAYTYTLVCELFPGRLVIETCIKCSASVIKAVEIRSYKNVLKACCKLI